MNQLSVCKMLFEYDLRNRSSGRLVQNDATKSPTTGPMIHAAVAIPEIFTESAIFSRYSTFAILLS